MANLDIYGQPQGQGESWPAIRRALQDLARGVSYYPYDLLGAPVDVANLALSAVGLGSKEPVLGSDQLRRISQQLGFAQPSTGSTAETVGRFAAGLTNPAAPVRAVQRVAEPTEAALRQIVREIETTPPAGQIAYHGSPYLFKQFDPMKVGTGEGAQAYGVGAGYTAEARPVAQYYAEILANRNPQNQNRLNAHANAQRLARLAGDPKYAADDIRFALETDPNNPQKELLTETLRFLDSGEYAKPLQKAGYLYKGDIPDEIIPSFIDWDKPVSQQKDVMRMLKEGAETRVRERLLLEMQAKVAAETPRPSASSGDFLDVLFSEGNKEATEKARQVAQERLSKMDISGLVNKELDSLKPKDSNWKLTGKELYEYLAKTSGGQDKATQLLNESGIRGIRYLDQTSRGEGKGTSNFVPFRPEDFKIQEINDRPLEEYIAQGLLAP